MGVSEDAKDKKAPAVKELTAAGVDAALYRGSVKRPTFIDKDKSLSSAFDTEAAREAVKKQVNFKEQYLLLFAWSGSGQDKLEFDVNDTEVIFAFTPGRTRDLRRHAHLFVLPKGATWKVIEQKP
jgi:hypothetical protein